MLTVVEALQKIMASAKTLDTHKIPIEKALSHVSVKDILADRPLPPFNRVAMDGFAVRSVDFKNGAARLRIVGRIQTGVAIKAEIGPGETVQIMTGAPCPKSADAIVKIENATIEEDWVVLNEPKIKPGLNIAPEGEDAPAGKILIRKGTALSTAGIAICASVGVAEVEVYKKPSLRIISTGSEIISPAEQPLPHQIRDCNSYTLRTLGRAMDLDVTFLGIGEDETGILGELIEKGIGADILILSGGVSMGEFDHIPGLLAAKGVKKILHNVRVKPGKPLWFGKTVNGSYVFGLPGNPVSVQTCFKIFVEPLIRKLSGNQVPENYFMHLPLSEQLVSKTNREHYMPGRFSLHNNQTHIQPVLIRGSGDFANFEQSHGLIKVPMDINRIDAHTPVEFLPWGEFW
ncbi:MAG: gephyrin-like molybdotransferase Glp [bacterium]